MVKHLSDHTYPNHQEASDIFTEKQRLFPQGCFALKDHKGISGYCLSHPWIEGKPPNLNTYLKAIPTSPKTLYLHDIVVAKDLRNKGLAGDLLLILQNVARLHQLPSVTLVSVNGSELFWSKKGFLVISSEMLQAHVQSAYGNKAVMMCARVG